MVNFLIFGEVINGFFILMIFVLSFFCLFFYLNIQKLKQRILDLELETKEILERKIIKEEKSDLVAIGNLSSENLNKLEEEVSLADDVEEVSVSRGSIRNDSMVLEKGNVSNEKNNKYQSKDVVTKYSPTQDFYSYMIKEKEVRTAENLKSCIPEVEKINSEFRFDLNEFIKRSERVVPKINETITTKEYLREISDKMANEMKPQTIELTDYEKEQEEHAIISYKELLSVRDSIKLEDDERESGEFIEELKKFRNNLG